MATHTTLKAITEIGLDLLSEQISANLIEFFNWGLLGVGAFTNVRIPTTGAYGGLDHRLSFASDNDYDDGQIWQSARQDWVWQTGIEYTPQPIHISGVYVDSTFYPSSTTGAYKHVVDYPHGRIIFDEPIDTESAVDVEYSYRMFTFLPDNVPWFRDITFNSKRSDDIQFRQFGSGAWDVSSQARMQLPAVIVEVTPERSFSGLQIGGGQKCRVVVDYHIFSENPWNRNKLIDLISLQNNKTIQCFDKNYMADNNMFPLTADGDLASGAPMYPTLVNDTGAGGAFWRKLWFADMRAYKGLDIPPLETAIVRSIVEVDLPEA
jgi:hypothetical protein